MWIAIQRFRNLNTCLHLPPRLPEPLLLQRMYLTMPYHLAPTLSSTGLLLLILHRFLQLVLWIALLVPVVYPFFCLMQHKALLERIFSFVTWVRLHLPLKMLQVMSLLQLTLVRQSIYTLLVMLVLVVLGAV